MRKHAKDNLKPVLTTLDHDQLKKVHGGRQIIDKYNQTAVPLAKGIIDSIGQ